jgi:hypothetical protein
VIACNSGLTAYNLGNLSRRLVLPLAIQSWSLTSPEEELVGVSPVWIAQEADLGGRVIRHARYVMLQHAESYVTSTPSRQLRGRIERLAWRTGGFRERLLGIFNDPATGEEIGVTSHDPQAIAGQDECVVCALCVPRPGLGEEAFHVNGFAILRCPRCKLLWTRVPPDYRPDSIYTQEHFQGGVSDGYYDYVGSEAFLAREYSARLAGIRTYQPRGRLFEIGCASGGFLQQARRYYSVYGVDVSDFAVRVARDGPTGNCVACHAIY